MATRRGVEQQISFALDQLGVRNQHHEFEHICRRVARERVCANILPATGPVTSGGDQGRDFETFRSYLAENQPDGDSWFAGRVSEGAVAFACTIQREKIGSKIKSDVATICGSGETLSSIHFFSGIPIAVGKRHKLQGWARDEHGVQLEIHDCEYLAEQLADPDLFWVASEYLSIPLELYPSPPTEEDEYQEVRARWASGEDLTYNHAAFIELRATALSLITESHRRADINFWLAHLEAYFRPTPTNLFQLKERARYEFLVLRLRIKGDFVGEEDVIREALKDAAQASQWSLLLDGAALCSYVLGAAYRGRVGIAREEALQMRDALASRVEELLEVSESPTERCWLMHIRGFLCVGGEDVAELSEVLNWWNKLVGEAEQARLYPIARLSRHLTELVPLLSEVDGYDELASRCDKLVAAREGDHAMAAACMRRAVELHKVGKVVRAVHELNRGKVLGYSQERLPQVTAAVLYAAQAYQELGCMFASKYYALAAAHLAMNNLDATPELQRFIRPAVVWCAQCDYLNGAFSQSLGFLGLAQKAERLFETGGVNLQQDDDFKRVGLYTGYILAAATEQPEAVYDAVTARIRDWPDAEDFFQLEDMAKEVFQKKPRGLQDGEPVFRGRLFADLEPDREVKWSALGVQWSVVWSRSKRATLAAEQFLAALQIVCVDLARWDLYTIPGDCRVSIEVDEVDEVQLTRTPHNQRSEWCMRVPREDRRSVQDRHVGDISAVVTILGDLSLSPALMDRIEEAYQRGLAGNTLVVGPYAQLWEGLIHDDQWEFPPGHGLDVAPNDAEHPELAWNESLIAEFDETKVNELLERRYERGVAGTQLSLPRWLRSGGDKIVEALRAEGWLDWQILAAFLTFLVNWRTAERLGNQVGAPGPEWSRVFQELLFSDETSEMEEVPVDGLSTEKLRFMIHTNAMSTLKGFGLALRQQTPNIDGVLRFLRAKARFFEDLDHDDPFVLGES